MTREEAIECIEAIHVQMFNSGNSKWTEACDMAIEALKNQRPHGEWILDAVSPCSIFWFRCSYCGYKYEAYKQSNFCPNCGASMSANDEQVTGKLNSEIVPDYRDGWKEGDEK